MDYVMTGVVATFGVVPMIAGLYTVYEIWARAPYRTDTGAGIGIGLAVGVGLVLFGLVLVLLSVGFWKYLDPDAGQPTES